MRLSDESRSCPPHARTSVYLSESLTSPPSAPLQLRKAKRKRQSEWSTERSAYGRTATGAYVDVEPLDIICGMGYDK